MWDRQTWYFVSRHPSLWKPGAASPRPSNQALSGAGWRAIVRGLEGNQQEREGGWTTPPSRLEGCTCCSGWACKKRKGSREDRTRWFLRDRDPETRPERDLQRQTKRVQRQQKTETLSEGRRFTKVEEAKS